MSDEEPVPPATYEPLPLEPMPTTVPEAPPPTGRLRGPAHVVITEPIPPVTEVPPPGT